MRLYANDGQRRPPDRDRRRSLAGALRARAADRPRRLAHPRARSAPHGPLVRPAGCCGSAASGRPDDRRRGVVERARPERRFAAGVPYDEISQLAATLDGLLDRLAASLRREQRFSAEMSHELRTPLAKIRTEGELALRRDREPAEYRRALEIVVCNATQMTTIIETLVAAEQNEGGLARGRCDAQAVIESLVGSSTVGRNGGVRVEPQMPGSRLVLGVDVDVAAMILQPVVENACRLAASVVRLSAQRRGGGVEIRVDDDGPGVRADESELIFEPGTRGSAAADRRARRRRPRPCLGPQARACGWGEHRGAAGHGRRPLRGAPACRLTATRDRRRPARSFHPGAGRRRARRASDCAGGCLNRRLAGGRGASGLSGPKESFGRRPAQRCLLYTAPAIYAMLKATRAT